LVFFGQSSEGLFARSSAGCRHRERRPARVSPRVSKFPAGTVDIFPTLIDVAALDPGSINTVHDGISLISAFSAQPARRAQRVITDQRRAVHSPLW